MVSYNEILKGTDGFSEANLLGKGRYGTVYKGTIENQGVAVAVKVFNLQQSGSYKSFQAECEALRRVRHRCLVKIMTCLAQRLDIAADIVDALDYLHNGCQPSVIHCDLKPGNILLTHDMRARVGDFGIARILNEAAIGTSMNSNSTIGIRGSIGYIAPGNFNVLPVCFSLSHSISSICSLKTFHN